MTSQNKKPMKLYLSVGGGKEIKDFVKTHDCGWCLAPQNSRPVEEPYFNDNGAFFAFRHKLQWDEVAFKVLLNKYQDYDFVVYPDIVLGKLKSLEKSISYFGQIRGPCYLAVQDTMRADQIIPYLKLDTVDGLFIGGSISWKFQTARMWADLAHLYNKKCHAGRVGSYEGLLHMHFCGVDSVDSSNQSRNNDLRSIRSYYNHLKFQKQLMI